MWCSTVGSKRRGEDTVSKSEGLWGECCSVGADIESRRGKPVSRTTWKYHIQSLQGSHELWVRPCWSRRPARELQEKERDQGHVAMFPKDLTTWNDSRWQMYCVGMLKERRKLLTLLVLAWHQRFDFDATTNFNILGFDTTKPQQTTSSAMPHVCSKFCTISQKINGQEIYTSDSQMSQKHWKTTDLVHRNTNVRQPLSFTYSKLTCTVNPVAERIFEKNIECLKIQY